jgi:hypothetical protein
MAGGEDQPRWYEWSAIPALGALLTTQATVWAGFLRLGGTATAPLAALVALRALTVVAAVSALLFILRGRLARLSRLGAFLERGWGTARSRAAFAEVLGFGGCLTAVNVLLFAHPATPHALLGTQAAGAALLAVGVAATAWMLRLMPAALVRSGRPAAGIGVAVCMMTTWGLAVGGWW